MEPTTSAPLASAALSMPLTPDYPQFVPTKPPADGSTIEAWRGEIRPFADDATARSVLADIEADRQLYISAGSLRNNGVSVEHWANPFLVDMNLACEVLICIQPDAYPRAYLLSPRFRNHYTTLVHPHPRGDHPITYEGAEPIPGLCILSAAEFQFDDHQNFYTQFLDQTTQYVAKHLIWLKTRGKYRVYGSERELIHVPSPGAKILDDRPVAFKNTEGSVVYTELWSGYWPGKKARATTPIEHIRQIRKTQRCWCGLNRAYGECCRKKDLSRLSDYERKKYG